MPAAFDNLCQADGQKLFRWGAVGSAKLSRTLAKPFRAAFQWLKSDLAQRWHHSCENGYRAAIEKYLAAGRNSESKFSV